MLAAGASPLPKRKSKHAPSPRELAQSKFQFWKLNAGADSKAKKLAKNTKRFAGFWTMQRNWPRHKTRAAASDQRWLARGRTSAQVDRAKSSRTLKTAQFESNSIARWDINPCLPIVHANMQLTVRRGYWPDRPSDAFLFNGNVVYH